MGIGLDDLEDYFYNYKFLGNNVSCILIKYICECQKNVIIARKDFY